jgi:uncharacterized protein (TIGR03086 family)
MSTSQRYRNLAESFTARVESVPDDRWEAQTPCEEWTARDLVQHVVDSSGLFLGFVGQPAPQGPPVAQDPLGAWVAARDAVQAGLDDPAIADREFDGLMGRSTYAKAVDKFLCTDLLLHGWDLARATGGDETMDPDEVRKVFDALRSFGDALRSPRAFGPALEPPPGADEKTQLLAYAGRAN